MIDLSKKVSRKFRRKQRVILTEGKGQYRCKVHGVIDSVFSGVCLVRVTKRIFVGYARTDIKEGIIIPAGFDNLARDLQ